MKRIDHVRKTVYLIVGCLTIFSLVLTICHKVGHCASDENSSISVSPYPYYYGNYIGYTDSLDFNRINVIVDDALTRSQAPSGSNVVVCYGSNPSFIEVTILNSNTFNVSTTSYTQTSDFSLSKRNCYWYFASDYSFGLSQSQGGFINFYSIVDNPTNNPIYKQNVIVSKYPFYIRYPEELVDSSGNQIFKEYSTPETPNLGHTKGGVLANYIDSSDLIEQDSSLPTVDTTSPADPSSNSGWFQKILNGLSKINQSIKGGVLTIGDYIGQGFENIINWLTEPFDSEQFNSDLNEIALINDFSNLKTLVENCGMFDWSDVTPAQSLSFTFDVGGAVLPHTSCVVDFSWYTGTVKNICVAVICTFLVLGLLVTIINQLPNIIGGKSGDKGGGSDS